MKVADTINVQDLASRMQDHVAKLDAGQSITQFVLPSKLMAAWTAAIEKNDRVTLAEIHKQRKAIVTKVRKHDPGLLHKRRLKAQYVDLNWNGTWSKPSDTRKKDAQAIILTVAAEISHSLRWAEEDESFAAVCARAKQSLPNSGEFWNRVIAPVTENGA